MRERRKTSDNYCSVSAALLRLQFCSTGQGYAQCDPWIARGPSFSVVWSYCPRQQRSMPRTWILSLLLHGPSTQF